VRFDGKYYSVSETYIHKPVTVIGNSKQISIFYAGKLIEVHEKLLDRLRSKSTKPHHLKPWEQACSNPDGLRGEALKIGPYVERVVHIVLKNGNGFIDFRRIWGILSLNKKYSNHEIDTACEEALAYDETSSKAIERFIIRSREELAILEPSLTESAPAGKFQRDLTEYSQMLLNLKPGGTYEH
jgi:hypothetical protein